MCIRDSPTTIASLSNHDTDDVVEGSSNLYYTDERVDDRINALIIAGTGVTKVYDDAANTYTLSVTQADVNSDNITEGSTNLFTTAARTRGHIGVSGSLAYNSGTGVISYTTPDTDGVSEGSSNLYYTDARADARIAAADTGDLTEGSNLYYTNARADARVVAGITGKLDASAVSTFGGTLIDDADAAAARTTLGLGTAAQSASGDFATAAQGATADSALQAETITLATLKTTVANSADFADFQTRIAAL